MKGRRVVTKRDQGPERQTVATVKGQCLYTRLQGIVTNVTGRVHWPEESLSISGLFLALMPIITLLVKVRSRQNITIQ